LADSSVVAVVVGDDLLTVVDDVAESDIVYIVVKKLTKQASANDSNSILVRVLIQILVFLMTLKYYFVLICDDVILNLNL
jgi:hypothetical protein